MDAFSACKRCSTVLAAVIEMPSASCSACKLSCCATSVFNFSLRCLRSRLADSRFEIRLHRGADRDPLARPPAVRLPRCCHVDAQSAPTALRPHAERFDNATVR